MTTPIYTYEAALQYISDNPNLSVSELQDLVRQTYTSSANQITLLYNNTVILKDGEAVPTWRIAESIGEHNADAFKTFNQTDAGQLLNSQTFRDTLAVAAANSPDDIPSIMSGLISDISLNLAETASGSVWTMTGGTRALDAIDTSSDYFQKELPALLRNTNVRDIKGVQYGLC